MAIEFSDRQRTTITAALTILSAVVIILAIGTLFWIVGAFFVMSIAAWYLLKKRHGEFARRSFGADFMISVPLVVKGQPERIHSPKNLRSFVIPISWRGHQAALVITVE